VAPSFYHGVACNWHWTSIKYIDLLEDVMDPLNELDVAFSASLEAWDESS
jgi:hypothetical protein